MWGTRDIVARASSGHVEREAVHRVPVEGLGLGHHHVTGGTGVFAPQPLLHAL